LLELKITVGRSCELDVGVKGSVDCLYGIAFG